MCNLGSERVGKVNVNVKELESNRISCKGKIKNIEAGTWVEELSKGLC